MKLKNLFLVAFLLITTSLWVFAHVDPEIPVPDNWAELIDVNKWFASMNALAGIVIFLTAAINTYLIKTTDKRWKQAMAIIVAIVLAVGSNLINFGFLSEAPIVASVLYGAGTGLLANGWYDVRTVKNLLKWIRILPNE